MGKAAIYNPYLDTLGGGERYTLSFAKVLAESGIDVDIQWHDLSIKDKLSQRFGLKLPDNIKIVENINRGEDYDICFWVSDGSIPTLRARKNYLHFQVPFHDVGGSSLINKMKLFRVNKVICNSDFTKKVVDKEYSVESVVLHPPVPTDLYKTKRKQNQICYVGRFSNLTQNKGHEVLIHQFKILQKTKDFKDWKLVIAGGTEVGADEYLLRIKSLVKKSNIEIIESPSVDKLKDIYGLSKIFWSASGYGLDENKYPEKMEHFGITLVEAMSASCVPVVFGSGGHKEIIVNGFNGYLWQSKGELQRITKSIVQNKGEISNLSKNAVESSKKYDYEIFKEQVLQIIK